MLVKFLTLLSDIQSGEYKTIIIIKITPKMRNVAIIKRCVPRWSYATSWRSESFLPVAVTIDSKTS